MAEVAEVQFNWIIEYYSSAGERASISIEEEAPFPLSEGWKEVICMLSTQVALKVHPSSSFEWDQRKKEAWLVVFTYSDSMWWRRSAGNLSTAQGRNAGLSVGGISLSLTTNPGYRTHFNPFEEESFWELGKESDAMGSWFIVKAVNINSVRISVQIEVNMPWKKLLQKGSTCSKNNPKKAEYNLPCVHRVLKELQEGVWIKKTTQNLRPAQSAPQHFGLSVFSWF